MTRLLSFLLNSGCLSGLGVIVISVYVLFSLKYSSKSSFTNFALKWRVMFGGEAFSKRGGVTSFGPPWGGCWLAQPKMVKTTAQSSKKCKKKVGFLFNIYFKAYKRFLCFYED